MSKNSQPPIMVSVVTAAAMLEMGKSTLEQLIREGNFPKPRKTAQRSARYLVSEITEWAESRPVSDILPAPNCARIGKTTL